jgi:hypothetical protein
VLSFLPASRQEGFSQVDIPNFGRIYACSAYQTAMTAMTVNNVFMMQFPVQLFLCGRKHTYYRFCPPHDFL